MREMSSLMAVIGSRMAARLESLNKETAKKAMVIDWNDIDYGIIFQADKLEWLPLMRLTWSMINWWPSVVGVIVRVIPALTLSAPSESVPDIHEQRDPCAHSSQFFFLFLFLF